MADPFEILFEKPPASQDSFTPTPTPKAGRQLTEGTGFRPEFSINEGIGALRRGAQEDTASRALIDTLELEKLDGEAEDNELLTPEKANEMYPDIEVKFDAAVHSKVAKEIARRAAVRNINNSIISQSSLGGGATEFMARLAAGAAASMTDPLELGLSIATGGIASGARVTAQQGFKAIGKQVLKETTAAVAATNLLESLITEGIVGTAAVRNQRLYGAGDYLTAVAMGTAIGTGISQVTNIGVSYLRSIDPARVTAYNKMAKTALEADRVIPPNNTIKEVISHHYLKGDYDHVDFNVSAPHTQKFYVPQKGGADADMSLVPFKGKQGSSNKYIASGYGELKEVSLKPDARIIDLDQPVPDDVIEALKEMKLAGSKLVRGRDRSFAEVISDISRKTKKEDTLQKIQAVLEEHGYHGMVRKEGNFIDIDPELDKNPHNRLTLFNDDAIAESADVPRARVDPAEQKIAEQRTAGWRREDAERLQSDEGKLFPTREFEDALDETTLDVPELETAEQINADAEPRLQEALERANDAESQKMFDDLVEVESRADILIKTIDEEC